MKPLVIQTLLWPVTNLLERISLIGQQRSLLMHEDNVSSVESWEGCVEKKLVGRETPTNLDFKLHSTKRL